MKASLRDSLSIFPGGKPRRPTAPSRRTRAAQATTQPSSFIALNLEMLADYEKRQEIEQAKILSGKMDKAAKNILTEILAKLHDNRKLTISEGRYLAASLEDILDGEEPLRALLMTKGPGRRSEDYRPITADIAILRFLGKSLNASRRMVATKRKISVDTVKRAVETIIRLPRSLMPNWQFDERLTSEFLEHIENTGSVKTACKRVAEKYEVDWKMICYSLGTEMVLCCLGAEAVRKKADVALSVLAKKKLEDTESDEIAVGTLKAVQFAIGCDYAVGKVGSNKANAASDILNTIMSHKSLVDIGWHYPSNLRGLPAGTLRGRVRDLGERRSLFKELLPGCCPPQGLSHNSYLGLNSRRALITFMVAVIEGEYAEGQWQVAEKIRSGIQHEIFKVYRQVDLSLMKNIGLVDPLGAGAMEAVRRALGVDDITEAVRRSYLSERLDLLRSSFSHLGVDAMEAVRRVRGVSGITEAVRRAATESLKVANETLSDQVKLLQEHIASGDFEAILREVVSQQQSDDSDSSP